jgi:hypothetical protein
MNNDTEKCQNLYAELFALCGSHSWRSNAPPAGYAATCNQSQRDPALRLPYIGLSRDGKYHYLLLLKYYLSGHLWLVPCRTTDAAATVDALMRWFAVFGVVLL